MDVNVSAEFRQKAIDWMNSKTKDTQQGIDILKEVGYKPHVVAIFQDKIARRDIPGKLEIEIRNYLRYHANPASEIHKDVAEDLSFTDVVSTEFIASIEVDMGENEYPDLVKKAITEFSDLYKQRSILHKGLKEVGETNTDAEKAERKRLLFVINACSLRMDVLYAALQEYKTKSVVPGEELFAESFDPDKIEVPTEAAKKEVTTKEFVLAEGVDALKKQSDNWRIKIGKAENKLNYQDEKKQEKLNQMPDGPKKITLQKRIAQLKAEKETIDLALANAK